MPERENHGASRAHSLDKDSCAYERIRLVCGLQ